MNRRDFLKLFRGLAVLPFIKPLLPVADNKQIADGNEYHLRLRRKMGHLLSGLGREYAKGRPVDGDFIVRDYSGNNRHLRYQFQPGDRIKLVDTGQVVCIKADGKLGVWNGEGQPIGIATRDLAPGETVTFSLNGGMADVVSKTT